jgi:hypothetical protein
VRIPLRVRAPLSLTLSDHHPHGYSLKTAHKLLSTTPDITAALAAIRAKSAELSPE